MTHKNYDFVLSYLRKLLEEHKGIISEKQYTVGCKAIQKFKEWNKHRNMTWDELYNEPTLGFQMDVEEYKDNISLFFAELKENEDNTQLIIIWTLILNTLSILIRIAIEEEGYLYIPEDLECINPDKAEDYFELIQRSSITPDKLVDYFEEICN